MKSEDKKKSFKLTQSQTLLLIGKSLGPYDVKDEIGHGGMGVVYRAFDRILNRDVALKIIPPQFAADEQKLKRFLREAKNIARLNHNAIVPIYFTGEERGINFIAMKFVEGETLGDIIDKDAPLAPIRALMIIREIAKGLSHAHDYNVIHRDIKPENIMLDCDGQVQIMDFGLARSNFAGEKLTESGIFLGTPEYSSPEQIRTTQADPRSDLYSLGVIFYEMLCRSLPFDAETPYEIFQAILSEDYPPLKKINPLVPSVLEGIVDKLLMKESIRRYQTAQELIADLEIALNRIEKGATAETQELPKPRRSCANPRIRFRNVFKYFMIFSGVCAILLCGIFLGKFVLNDNSGKNTNKPLISGNPDKTNKTKTNDEVKNRIPVIVIGYFNNVKKISGLSWWMEKGLSEIIATNIHESRMFEVITEKEIIQHQKELDELLKPDMKSNRTLSARNIAKKRGANIFVSGSIYEIVNNDKKNEIRIIIVFEDLIKDKTVERFQITLEVESFDVIDKLSILILKKLKGIFYPERI